VEFVDSIVALTANAMVGFEQQILEAGLHNLLDETSEYRASQSLLNCWVGSRARIRSSQVESRVDSHHA
jgi:hypothetical protein